MLIEDIYCEYERDLKKYARSICRNDAEADDLLQETFLRAMPNIMMLNEIPDYKRRAWLFKVMKNIFLDRRRRERFEVPLEETHEPMLDIGAISGIEMQELMGCLSPKLQDIVFKRYWMGMTSTEIAESLSIPAATIRYHLHTAIRQLRKNLKVQEEDD